MIKIRQINFFTIAFISISLFQYAFAEDISTNGDKSPIVSNTTGNVIINYGDVDASPEIKPIIEGDWNDETAKKEIFRLLSDYKKNTNSNFGYESAEKDAHLAKFIHKIYGFYHLTSGDAQSVIGIAFTTPSPASENECHSCGVSLSFIEFNKIGNNWKLGKVHLNKMHDGSWGEPPYLRAISIGFNIFGILSESGFTQGGYIESGVSLFAYIGSEYKHIFSTGIELDDSATGEPGRNNWNAILHFNKVGSSYYDIEVIKKGVEDKKAINEKTLYTFDGQKYSSSNFIN